MWRARGRGTQRLTATDVASALTRTYRAARCQAGKDRYRTGDASGAVNGMNAQTPTSPAVSHRPSLPVAGPHRFGGPVRSHFPSTVSWFTDR